MNLLLEIIKNLTRPDLAKPINFKKKKNYLPNKLYNFGNRNYQKKFYIIKKNYAPNGLWSNVHFVLDHIQFAVRKKLIPVVDMKNYQTIYNEKRIINGTLNAWNYYFELKPNYNLNQVYASSNVFFSKDKRLKKTLVFKDQSLKNIFFKRIRIKNNILLKVKKLKEKIFSKNEKVMGVHVRGTLQKIIRNHTFPPTPKDMLKIASKIFINENCTKIFLVSEDLTYIELFKKKFKNKLILLSRPRSKPSIFGSHNKHFSIYNRKLHRYKFGEETLIDTLLLSYTNVFLFTNSNVRSAAMSLAKKKQVRYEIKLDNNSNNIFIARWLWYLKFFFPMLFGKINYKIIKYR